MTSPSPSLQSIPSSLFAPVPLERNTHTPCTGGCTHLIALFSLSLSTWNSLDIHTYLQTRHTHLAPHTHRWNTTYGWNRHIWGPAFTPRHHTLYLFSISFFLISYIYISHTMHIYDIYTHFLRFLHTIPYISLPISYLSENTILPIYFGTTHTHTTKGRNRAVWNTPGGTAAMHATHTFATPHTHT